MKPVNDNDILAQIAELMAEMERMVVNIERLMRPIREFTGEQS